MFKEGRFYAIQGRRSDSAVVYLEATATSFMSHHERLKKIARKAAKPSYWEEDDEADFSGGSPIKVNASPFAVKTWPIDTNFKIVMTNLRHVRDAIRTTDIDPNSIRVVIVETGVQSYIPEEGSDAEVELRKFALEKLSKEEKDLLKVTHWEVYHKLGDRSMFEDDEEEND